MGAPDVRSFLGGSHPQDKGLYVSSGGFSREARYEAERANMPLALINRKRCPPPTLMQSGFFELLHLR